MGTKSITLFEPSAIADLKIDLSTSPLNVSQLPRDNHMYKDLFDKSHTGILHPGDAIFIPSCWPHSVKYTGTTDPCVSFNCFLESFHINSVYGNDDPYQIRDAIKLLDRVDAMIGDLPWTLKATCWSKISLKAKQKCDEVVARIRQ